MSPEPTYCPLPLLFAVPSPNPTLREILSRQPSLAVVHFLLFQDPSI